ncbi:MULTISPECIES: FecR family protein [Sphingobacterium]|uniref:FecR family protein n=1 Tax=Sphingobacterium TaxID=28453 RepID=UPI00257E670E|nr:MULTISPECIES: FecR family protein [Sphingobacterium]
MDNKSGRDLLSKYLEGNASELEKQVVEEWYAKKMLSNISKQTKDENYERIKSEMWTAIIPEYKRPTFKLGIFKVAAALLIISSISILYFLMKQKYDSEAKDYVKQEILPGKNGATLTLSSGRQIKLAELTIGKITKDEGISIYKSQDGFLVYENSSHGTEASSINKLSTSNGETYMVILPDKSKVWLNAASSLTFNTNFKHNGIRKVILEGEGYFEIAKDRLPFLVETAKQKVQVTGTHFNINAYQKDNIKTTLLEGSVNVLTHTETRNLSPGQQSINHNGQLAVRKESVEKVVAWKDGYFTFDGDLETTMAMLASWYDVEIEFTSSAPKGLKLWGRVSRNNTLQQVLSQLERTNKVNFIIKERKVYITQ